MKFVKLTDLDNRDVWIAPDWVQVVRHPLENEFKDNDGLGSVIVLGNYKFMVKESADLATHLLVEGNDG